MGFFHQGSPTASSSDDLVFEDAIPSCSNCSSLSPASSPQPESSHLPVLAHIASNNPDLEELEIIGNNFQSAFHKNKFLNSKLHQFNPWYEKLCSP